MLAGRAHARAGDADVDRHRQAELGAGGVDGVVELVVERVLVDERRDPHQRDGRVLGQGAQPRDLLHGPVRPVGRRARRAGGPGGRPPRRAAGPSPRPRCRRRCTPMSTPLLSMVTSRCCSVEEAERSPPSSSGMPSFPAWPRKAAAALPLSALTQRSTTVTPGRLRRAAGVGLVACCLRRCLGLGGAQVAHALRERLLDEPVVVLGDEGVHALLEERAQERVEGVVRLGEVEPGGPVPEVLQPGPPLGLREAAGARRRCTSTRPSA